MAKKNTRTRGGSSAEYGPTVESAEPFDPAREQIEGVKPYLIGGLLLLVACLAVAGTFAYLESKERAANQFAYKDLQAAFVPEPQSMGVQAPREEDTHKRLDEQLLKLNEVIKKHEGSPAAIDAVYCVAKTTAAKGDSLEAAKLYAAFYQKYNDHEPMSSSARLNEAQCYLDAKQFDEAYKRFSELINATELHKVNPQLKANAQFNAALSAMALGNREDCKKHLDNFLLSVPEAEDTGGSPFGRGNPMVRAAHGMLSTMKIFDDEALKKSLNPPPKDEEPETEAATPAKKAEPAAPAVAAKKAEPAVDQKSAE